MNEVMIKPLSKQAKGIALEIICSNVIEIIVAHAVNYRHTQALTTDDQTTGITIEILIVGMHDAAVITSIIALHIHNSQG